MRISNGTVFCDDYVFRARDVFCDGETIADGAGGEVVDAAGCIVAPGFVDIHIHGAAGCDFFDGTREALGTIARYLAAVGVTGFLGTSIACGRDALVAQYENAGEYMSSSHEGCATMFGIHMEGPFFSMRKKAAFDPRYVDEKPDIAFFERLCRASGGSILIADVAPDLEGAAEYIRAASGVSRVAIAHSDASYEQARAGYLAGAKNTTHLFNAMSPLSHRGPGVVGAAFDCCEFAELICDGIHIHPSAIRAAFKMFGERICLVSDAMRACGMGNGRYSLGSMQVTVSDGRATLDSGTIAGSATPLSECFRRAVSFGIPKDTALRAASANPAMAAGIFDKVGSITAGKRADLVLLDEKTLEVRRVIIGGKLVG